MEVRRIGPDGGFLREFTDVRKRVQHLETRPSGVIATREMFIVTDPETGVKTIMGKLPDGTTGFQPFVGDIVPPPVATAPTATAQPGTMTITWDGTFVGGAEQPSDFEHLNVIAHKIVGGSTVLSLEAGAIRLPFESLIINTDIISFGEQWQFSFESEDYNGNISARSARSAVLDVLSLVDDSLVGEALADLAEAAQTAQEAAQTAQNAAGAAQDDADAAAAAALAASNLAGSKGVVYTQSTAPSGDYSGLWIDTAHNNIPRRFLGVRSALVANLGGGASIATRLTSLGWAVSAIATTPSLEDAAKYDLVAFDAGYAGLLAATQARAAALFERGISVFTSGNDTTAMSPLFTGAVNRGTPKNNITPVAGHAAGTGWNSYADSDLLLYLTGVNSSATVTGKTLVTSLGTDQPVNLVMEHATNFARWAHVQTYGTPSDVLNAHLGWISNNWVAIQDQGVIAAAAAAAAAQTKADQAFTDAASAATAAGNAQTSANSKNTIWYQDDQPTGTGHKVGDTWFDTNDNYKQRTWNGSVWQTTQDSWSAQQTADSKGITYTQSVTPPVSARLPQNLWNDTSLGEDKVVVKYWSTVAGAWTPLADKAATEARTVADSKGETIYSSTEPTVAQRLTQNLWIDTTNGLNLHKRWDGFGWVTVIDTRIPATATAVTAADAKAQTALNDAATKSIIFTQSTTPPVSARLPQTLWNDTSLGLNNVVVKYWDTVGLAWTALADKAATDAATLAGNKSKVVYSNTAPTGADANVLTLWIDTTGGANTPKKWVSGTTWTAVTDKVATDAATTAASKGEVIYSDTAPAAAKQLPQNLWVDTTGGLNMHKRWNTTTSAWVVVADARIAQTITELSALTSQVSAVSAQADRSITTFYGTSTPSTPESGDLWLTGVAGEPMKRYNGSSWATFEDPNVQAAYTKAGDAQSAADAKVRTFAQTSAPTGMVPNDVGDLWIDTDDKNKLYRYDGAGWVAVRDDTIADAQSTATSALSTASTAVTAAATAQSTANGKNKVYYQPAQPSGGTYVVGDQWVDTDDNFKLRTWTGSAWQLIQDSVGAQSAAISAAATDATTKATNAQAAAIAAAATDAQNKANAAQQAAIDAAQVKFDQVWAAARSYVNPLTSASGIVLIQGLNPTVTASPTAMGGKALLKSGTGNGWWADRNAKQAFDPTALYRYTVRARVVTPSTSPVHGTGAGTIYTGIQGYAADGTTLVNITGQNSTSNQHYLFAETFTPTDGTWKDYVGYFKGNAATTSTGGNTVLDPRKLHADVRFFEPMVILDYNNGNGVWEVSHWSVDVVDAAGHQALVDATNKAATAKAEAIAAAAADATSKANAAQTAAVAAASADATSKANAAEQAAKTAAAADAASKAATAESNAIAAAATTAQQKADAAKQAAIDAAAITAQLKADGAADAAIQAAATDAAQKAAAAQQAAIDAAALDATSKAATAKAEALAGAATDAQTRATQAKADAEATAALDATAKADAAQRAAIQAQAYSLNPSFEDWTGTIPANYTTFVTNPTKETTTVRTGKNAVRFNCTDATTQRGLQFNAALAHAPYLEYLTVEIDVRLDSGSSFGGSGVLVDWNGMTGGNRVTLSLASEIPAPVTGRWYRVTKVIRKPATATGTFTNYSAWLMGQYSAGMGTQAVKNVIFDWINVRPATTEEITAYGLPATVSSLSDTVNTKTKSWWQPSQPPLTGNTNGDLWFDTDDQNKIYIWNTAGNAWLSAQDGNISSLNVAVTAAQASANGKNKVIYSTSPASGTTGFVAGDTWFQRDGSNNIIGQWEFTTNWQARKVDDAMIANLNAAKIVAGTLDAQRIGANTISVAKLLVADLTNNLENPSFETGTLAGWDVVGGWAVNTATPSDGTYKALTSYTGVKQSITNTAEIYLAAGEKVRVKLSAYSETPSAGIQVGYALYNSVGGALEGTVNSTSAGSWNEQNVVLTAATSGRKRLQIFTTGAGTGWLRVDNVRMYKMNTGELIVDGAIKANSAIIENGAIGNAQIADLNADKINAGTVAAGRLDAEIIRGKIIDATDINAVDILAQNSITANNGIIASLDAGKITSGLIQGWQIAANAIDASKLNVSIGGSNLVSNSSFEADSDANGLADDWSVWVRGAGDAGRTLVTTRPAGLFPGSTYSQRVTSNNVGNAEQSSLQATTLFSIAPGASAVISIYGRASVAGNFPISIRCQDDLGAYKGDAQFIAAFTTTAQRFVGTVIIPTGTTLGKATISTPPSLTSGHWFEVDGMQVELGNVASSWGPKTEELLPGTIKAGMIAADAVTATNISATALNGKTITGALIQTDSTPVSAARGIKLTTAELGGWDAAGVKNFSLTSAGVLAIRGSIESGSTIKGASLTGAGIETTTTANRGVKIQSTGVSAYDGSGNMTFKVDGSTGVVEAPGIKANSIKGDKIEGGTVTADKLLISDFTNLLDDASIVGPGWIKGGGAANSSIVADANEKVNAWRLNGSGWQVDVTNTNVIPVTTADRFVLSMRAYSTLNASGYLRVIWYTETMAYLTIQDLTVPANANAWTSYSIPNLTPPATAKFMKIQPIIGSSATSGYILFASMTLRRRFGGELIVDGAINGQTVTGATIQTEATASRGIKLTSAELAGYDNTGQKNFSLTSGGALSIRGDIEAGSKIKGVTLEGSGIETSGVADRGVKIKSTGVTAYDGSGNMTFKVDAATGEVQAPGIKANSIKGDKIESGTVTADKILVTGSNLHTDPGFRDTAGWLLDTGVTVSTTGGKTGGGSLTVPASTVQRGGYYAANFADKRTTVKSKGFYRVSVMVKSATTMPAGAASIWFRSYKPDNTMAWAAPNTVYSPAIAANTWGEITGIFEIPDGYTQAAIGLYKEASFNAALTYSDVFVQQAASGELIVDGAIKTAHMTAGTIDGGVVSAGTLTATQIKAKSVSIDKLLITSTDNLIQEGDFSGEGASWQLPTNFAINATAGRKSLPALVVTNTATLQTSYNSVGAPVKNPIEFQSDAGNSYRMEAWVKCTASVPVSGAFMNARFTSTTGSTTDRIAIYSTSVSTSSTPPSAWQTPQIIPANTWTQITGIVTAPADTISVAFSVNSAASLSTGTLTWDTVAVTRAANGKLVVDGSITAGKLETDLVLATRIVAGDPAGTHAEMSPQGFRVYADAIEPGAPSTEVVRLGVADTNDYFAITQSDGTMAAAISQDGVGSFAEVNAMDSLVYRGTELQNLIDVRGTGVVAAAYRITNPTVNATVGGGWVPYLRLEVTMLPGRLYKVWTSPIRLDTTGDAGCTVALGFNTSTLATTSNAIIFTQAYKKGAGRQSVTLQEFFAIQESVPTTVSIIMFFGVQEGTTGVGAIRADLYTPVRLTVEDMGTPAGVANGTHLDLAVTPPAPKNTYVTQFAANNMRSYDGANNWYQFNTSQLHQGLSPAGYGNLKGIATFPDMTAALSGATINYIRVYFKFNHWYYNSGGTARIGLHTHSAVPGTFSQSGTVVTSGGWPKPGARWVDIPSTHWANFKNGTYKGVSLEGDGTYGTYGYADAPTIEISYTK